MIERVIKGENLLGLYTEVRGFLQEQGIEGNGELVFDRVSGEKGVKRVNRAYFIFNFTGDFKGEGSFFLKIDIAIKKIKKAFIFEKVMFKREEAKIFFSLDYLTEEGSRF